MHGAEREHARRTAARRSGPPSQREGFEPPVAAARSTCEIVFLGLLIAYAIAFVLENDKHVHVHFVLGTARTSLIWLILLSVALGLAARRAALASYTGAAAGATSARGSRRTPSSISAGETKLKASRIDDRRTAEVGAGNERHARLARARSSSDASISSGSSSQRK